MKSYPAIAVFLGVAFWLPAAVSAQPPSDLNSQKKQVTADLENFAIQISALCAQPGFRGFLRSEIAKSKNREQIIELDVFLDRAMKQQGMPPGLAKTRDFNSQARGRLKSSGLLNLNELANQGYDLYIPVDAHKKKWQGGKDFLVAFAQLEDEKDLKAIVAYQVWDGKRVLLDPRKAPETVVLAVAPCEHPSHERPKASGAVASPPEKEPVNLKNGPDPLPGGEHTYLGVPYVLITKDNEGWLSGKPEVYCIVGQYNSNGPKYKKVWLNSGSIDVNNVNQWYYIGDCTSCPLYVYFDSNYSDLTYYAFWESDGGFTVPLTPYLFFPYLGATPYYGVTIGSGDDFFGAKYINKNDIPYSDYHLQSNGSVRFKVDKDP